MSVCQRITFVFIIILVLAGKLLFAQQSVYLTENGMVSFTSDAPLEIIKAQSNTLQGAIDIDNQTFIFVLVNGTFEGFNSPLQQEHFHENYMESNIYQRTTFTGKIIEPLNLTNGKEQIVRAKGILDLHGVKQERIIKAHIVLIGNVLTINSIFTVMMDDHHIRIPKVVSKKVAPEIEVKINATFIKSVAK